MKTILFLITLLWAGNTTSLNAAEASNTYVAIKLTEREILKDPDIGPENTPITRSVIMQPVYAHLYNNVVSIDFIEIFSTAIISITNEATGEIVYSETFNNPSNLNINLGGESSGSYFIVIKADDTYLEGCFSF